MYVQEFKGKIQIAIILGLILIGVVVATDPFTIGLSTNEFVYFEESSSCQLAQETKASIRCLETEEVFTPERIVGGFGESTIQQFVIPNGYEAEMQIRRTCAGIGIGVERYEVRIGDSSGPIKYTCDQASCSGIRLDSNNVYYVKEERDAGAPDCAGYVTMTWKKQELLYSDPFGAQEIPIPGTDYCVDQKGTGSYNIPQLGDIASQSKDSQNTIISDLQGTRSLGYEHGKGFTQVLDVLLPLANIVNNVYEESGIKYAASCDQLQRKVYVFEKTTGLDGQCYGIKGQPVIDGTGWQESFCCDTGYCQHKFGSEYQCLGYKCVVSDVSTDSCRTNSQCLADDPYFTDDTLQAYERLGSCIDIDPATGLGRCTYDFVEIACEPGRTYFKEDGSEECCIIEDGQWSKGSCDSIPKECPPGVCCLAGNEVGYTLQDAPEGKECCDFNGDKIGYIADSCEEGKDDGLLDLGFFEGLSQFFGGGIFGDMMAIIAIIIIIFVIIMVFSYRRRR